MAPAEPQPWRAAWSDALYGPAGFSVRGGRGPRHDFSTSVTRGPALGRALARLVTFDGGYDVVDVGAGDGRLIADLRMSLAPDLAARGRFVAVELAPRPADLPGDIEWSQQPPAQVSGLLIAHELLDTVPCEIVEVDPVGQIRVVALDDTGQEVLGNKVDPGGAAWLERWWPISQPGQRADVGSARDALWHDLTARLTHGLALAIDYGHLRDDRPVASTLAGWSRGRSVVARPDGECDLTAHVAFDSLLQPGDLLMSQRAALAALGLAALGLAGRADPPGPATARDRLTALAETSRLRSLMDPAGLGGYHWLIHPTGPHIDVGALGTRETGA